MSSALLLAQVLVLAPFGYYLAKTITKLIGLGLKLGPTPSQLQTGETA